MGVEAAWLWGRRLPRFLHRDQVHVGADVVLALLDGFLFAAAPTGFASTLRSSTLARRVLDLGGSRRGRWPAGEKNGGGVRRAEVGETGGRRRRRAPPVLFDLPPCSRRRHPSLLPRRRPPDILSSLALATVSPPASRLPIEVKSERERRKGEERRERGGVTWQPDKWGPRGFHADSVAPSVKTGIKTTEGSKLND
uniref:Uncharacterized protein n=1 Tax=Oryza nivara TaxID=4536 RepID=A0A0E0GL27_ORYNI